MATVVLLGEIFIGFLLIVLALEICLLGTVVYNAYRSKPRGRKQ